ncbi:MAG: AAA family ATPase, partial [Oscillospiraceae bacterium]
YNCFICRKNQPDGEFVKTIKNTFDEAAKNTPAIVFLDDIDKFANEDDSHRDAEEYVTVQSCIDEVKDKDVIVFATANDIYNMPESLLRAGRFDKQMQINAPHGNDAAKIISHYLENKKIAEDFDAETVANILDDCSCAELETIINVAEMYACFNNKESISMRDFLVSYLRSDRNLPFDAFDTDKYAADLSDKDSRLTEVIYHEAGHAVLAEIIHPGSVSLVSVYYTAHGVFCGLTKKTNIPHKNGINDKIEKAYISLAGTAALDKKFGIKDYGNEGDLNRAFNIITGLTIHNCYLGFSLNDNQRDESDAMIRNREVAVSCEVEKIYHKTKEILSANYEFFERLASELADKRILYSKDIKRIREMCDIKEAII